MSSTRDDNLRQAIGPLFDDLIHPMAERMRAQGQQPFPLKPDASLESYYEPRWPVSMARDDFIAPSCIDFYDLEHCLKVHWQKLGRAELIEAAPRIATAARAAHAAYEGDKPDVEVSPYIYVMC